MRVLIVEDSRAMRAILSRITEGLGAQTQGVGDGEEALSVLAADQGFDVVLIDWNMPRMNGLELVQAIRARPELEALKLIMVTTETEHERVKEALDSGADEYVMKPFSKEALLDKMRLLGFEL